MTRSDVLIIGSGISALTSALLLAKKGKSVVLLEQYSKPGGYMHSFRRFGETFDSGAHYVGALGPGQPFRVLLDYLGVHAVDLFSPLDSNGFDVFKFPAGDVLMPQGYERAIEELSSVFPNEKRAIRTYFEMIREVVRLFPTYHFSDTTDPMAAVEALETPLSAVVEKLTSNTRLQSVLYAYCNLHGVFPRETPFGFHAIVTDSLLIGPYGLLGGGDALVKRFTDKIESYGGKILTKHKVVKIKTKDRMVSAVVTENAQVFNAEWIISSIHPKATFRLLEDMNDFTPAFKERLRGIKESAGIFGMYAACQNAGSFQPNRNYYYFKSNEPAAMFAKPRIETEPSVVFASTSKRNWKPGSGEKLPLSFLAPCDARWFEPWSENAYGKRSLEYEAFKKNLSKNMMRLVSRYDSNLTEAIASSVTSSPLTNLHFNGSEEGSAYGIYHSIQNTGARSLGPRTKIINLLLAGQSCLFPGLLGAAISALRTCGHINGIKPVLKELSLMGAEA